MAFKEVYGALQTKVVDGQENTWSNIYGKKFFEVQDGVTETNHGIIDYLLVTSTDFWGGLPDDQRTQLGKIVTEVTGTRNAESAAVNQENKDLIIQAGGEVRIRRSFLSSSTPSENSDGVLLDHFAHLKRGHP